MQTSLCLHILHTYVYMCSSLERGRKPSDYLLLSVHIYRCCCKCATYYVAFITSSLPYICCRHKRRAVRDHQLFGSGLVFSTGLVWFFVQAWIFAIQARTIWLIVLLTITTTVAFLSQGYLCAIFVSIPPVSERAREKGARTHTAGGVTMLSC